MKTNNTTTPILLPKIKKPLFLAKTKWRCLIASDINYINKYKPKMLSIIELSHLKLSTINIRELSRALKDTKTAISLTVHWTNFHHTQIIRHLLKTTNHWKKLNLDFNFNEEVRYVNDKVFKCLSSCKDLSSFQIKISGQEKITNLLVNRISQELNQLKTLKKLHLNLNSSRIPNNFQQKDDSNASILLFKYPRSLSSLHLDFPEPDFVSHQFLPRFALTIQDCRLLKSFHIDFQKKCNPYTFSEMEIIASVSEKIHHARLSKQFDSINQHFEPSLTYLQHFQSLKNLSTLNLYIGFSLPKKESTIFLNDLYTKLALLTNLRNLHLRLHSFQYPSQTLPHPKSLTKLEKFHLHVFSSYSHKINHEFIKTIVKNLPHFQHLTHLTLLSALALDLSVFDLSPKEQKNISLAIKNLPKLSSLSIKLPQFSEFKDFANNLTEIPKLNSLSLTFKGKRLDDQEIEILASKLANCRFLESLELSFKLEEKFSENGFNHLSQGLGKLPLSIKNLALWFGEYWTIDNSLKTIALLFDGLAHLKGLESLQIFLPGLQGAIGQAAHKYIIEHQNLKHLNKFTLKSWILIGISFLVKTIELSL